MLSIYAISILLLTVVTAIYLVMRYRADIQMMQQNSYRNDRYLRWWRSNKDSVRINRMIDFITLLAVAFVHTFIVALIALAVIIFKLVILARKKYKKPLVMTKRAWRLLITMVVTSVIFCLGAYCGAGYAYTAIPVALLLLAVLSWMLLLFSNWMMHPVEAAINKMYVDDAKRILAQMPDMKIISITGSYGKTSTKHYLYRILSEQFDVLMTPGSFNTPMGVVRTVREQLKPYNNVFIVEMGAKQPGDIKEICDIVHPQIGIITAVGEQHLESFKTIENVQRTKFELADALPSDGLAVLNDDFEYVANRKTDNVKTLRYAIKRTANADYKATDIEYSAHGTKFTIEGNGKTLQLETKLVGECNISNLMGAVIVAIELGVSDEKIRYAVCKIEQVEHRLNMKRTPGGVTIIDDAFNSNPDGSRMALDVLSRMTGGKRIIVTPGMIELGSKQEEYNRIFGESIAKACDVAIIVGQYNRDAIVSGIRSKKFDEKNLYTVESFTEAQKVLGTILRQGDTVLYENDLPDTFK